MIFFSFSEWYDYYQVISGDRLQSNKLISSSIPHFSSVSIDSLGNTLEQQYRKFQIPGTAHSMNIGLTELVILSRERVIYQYSLSPICDQPNDFYVRITSDTPIVFITCMNGFVFKVWTIEDSEEYKTIYFPLRSSVPAFVYSNDELYLVFMKRGTLRRRRDTNQEDVPLYSRSEISSKFGSCTGGKWIPRLFNGTFFVFECSIDGGNRFLVSGIDQNVYCPIPSGGKLTIIKGRDEAVIKKANSFTFYSNGFCVFCTVSLPLPVVRVDYGVVNNVTVLVFFSEDHIWVYNTGDGCKDNLLKTLANGSFPCLYGACDGYYITDNGYLLATVNDTTNELYRVKLYNLVNVNESPYSVLNLERVPKGINVVKEYISDTSSDTVILPSPTNKFLDISSSINDLLPYSPVMSLTPTSSLSTVTITFSDTYRTSSLTISPTIAPAVIQPSPNFIVTVGVPVIVVFCVGLVCVVLLIVSICYSRKRKKKTSKSIPEENPSSSSNLKEKSTAYNFHLSRTKMVPGTIDNDNHGIRSTTSFLSSQPTSTSEYYYQQPARASSPFV